MNKKQARKIALEIAITLINQEIVNPTGISSGDNDEVEAFYDCDDNDAHKVFEQLEIIMTELQRKRGKFAE